ncbi:MAG: GH92 family glycosyl hydrolase, partial [Cyclobacteriaceae bacterium]|nr:GH92 family glycosyl hydrolase [Cyclobacteriaceae bacterium]
MKIKKLLKIGLLIIIIAAIGSCTNSNSTERDYTALVNPFIGTKGSGNTFMGPVLPYGMVQLGPYLRYSEDHKSGTIYGFSHTHTSGMAGGGNGVRGNILFMPIVDNDELSSGTKNAYQSRFSHSNELASPGYYKVILDDYHVTAELTASTRTGFHKYTFPETNNAGIILKLGAGSLTMNDEEISGNGNGVYFVAKFSKKVNSYELSNNDKIVNTSKSIEGNNVKGIFRFETKKDEAVFLKVGISMVSVEGARKNLSEELPGWDFEQVRENARNAWNKELGKIVVEGGSKTDQIIFYTALYHSMIHPNIYMDVDKKFRSESGKIYTATDFDNYTNFSLWDTFRALHPLYTIINRERTSQFIRSFLERYDHNGRMLIMEFDGVEGEQPPMIGYHSLSVLADAYVKGIRNYDVPKAYE